MTLVDRAKGIILSPKSEWSTISGETPNIGQILTTYVLPLAVIPAIAAIIGFGLIGMGAFVSLSYGLAMGFVHFVSAFIIVYLAAFVIDWLAPNFGSEKNLGRAVQLVAYSYTPAWVAGVLFIFPFLSWLVTLASLYGLYLMYLGLPALMKTPPDKAVGYLVVSIIVLIIVYAVIGSVLALILLPLFGVAALGSAAMGM